MRQRKPLGILGLLIITIGIYGIYWLVSTKNEMKKLGADIPTAWLIIVPFVSLWWYWKYSQGVEKVTNGKFNGILTFVLFLIIGSFTAIVVQTSFNEVGQTAPVAAETLAPTPSEVTPGIAGTASPEPTPSDPGQPASTSQIPPSTPPTNTPPTSPLQ